jgi:hypothetical protein
MYFVPIIMLDAVCLVEVVAGAAGGRGNDFTESRGLETRGSGLSRDTDGVPVMHP